MNQDDTVATRNAAIFNDDVAIGRPAYGVNADLEPVGLASIAKPISRLCLFQPACGGKISIILYRIMPRGTLISATSPHFLPRSPCPMGLEVRILLFS